MQTHLRHLGEVEKCAILKILIKKIHAYYKHVDVNTNLPKTIRQIRTSSNIRSAILDGNFRKTLSIEAVFHLL